MLFVEDGIDDVQRLLRHLRRAGDDLMWGRVLWAKDVKAVLGRETRDVAPSDCSMPQFDADAASDLLRKTASPSPSPKTWFPRRGRRLGPSRTAGGRRGSLVRLRVRDNGVRLPRDFKSKQSSLGLKLVWHLAGQLGARLKTEAGAALRAERDLHPPGSWFPSGPGP